MEEFFHIHYVRQTLKNLFGKMRAMNQTQGEQMA
jgi:hypothetical protein